ARGNRYTTYPVVDDGRVLGLLSFRCLAELPREEWNRRRVAECMVPLERVPVLSADEPAIDALNRLSATDANRALVLDGDRVAGLLSISDLARALETRRWRGRRGQSRWAGR